MSYQRAPDSVPGIKTLLTAVGIGGGAALVLLLLKIAGVAPDAGEVQFIGLGLGIFAGLYAAASIDRRPTANMLQPMPLVVFAISALLLAQGFWQAPLGFAAFGGAALLVYFVVRFAPESASA